MTNYEKIKQMTIEEMAEFLHKISNCDMARKCYLCPLENTDNCEASGIMAWLESEVDDD